MASYIFTKLLDKAASQNIVPNKTADARQWFRDEASNINTTRQREIFNKASYTSRIIPGQMLMFLYDAKHKGTLPYFDQFPLIFPLGPASDGFLGLNLHYLPHTFRAQLMDALYETSNNKKYDDSTKLRVSYDILNSASKFRYFKPCVKHYLNSNVKSRFVYISPDKWDIALFLPTERFAGARKQRVWEDSKRIISGR